MQPRYLAAVVAQCVRQAQVVVGRRTEDILRATVPGDPLIDELVATVHKAFTPPPAAESATTTVGPRTPSVGRIDCDDNWGDQSFLVRR